MELLERFEPDDFAPEPLTLSAVYPQHRQGSRPVQALIEFLRERL